MNNVFRHGRLMALAAGTALLLSACGNKDQQSGATVASVNGVAVKESRIDAQYSQIPPALTQGREADVKRQILDRVIDQELISQEAKRLHVDNDKDYQKQLKAVEDQLQANFVIAKAVNDKLTPETLRQAYEATKAQHAYPAVKAKHILVASEAEASNIIKVVNPQNFSDLAKKYSKGPSANTGGDLGWFRRESMIPEFAAVAFATPVGTVATTPVKTQFGWHVILVEDRNDHYVPPFEQMEQQLRQELAQQVVQGYLNDLRKNATITYSDSVSATAPAAGAAAPAAK
jgi:peptidyl-prolyl cis-trans isomerase C